MQFRLHELYTQKVRFRMVCVQTHGHGFLPCSWSYKKWKEEIPTAEPANTTMSHAKWPKQSVQTAVKSARFRLNRPRADQYIVATASQNTEHRVRPGTNEILMRSYCSAWLLYFCDVFSVWFLCGYACGFFPGFIFCMGCNCSNQMSEITPAISLKNSFCRSTLQDAFFTRPQAGLRAEDTFRLPQSHRRCHRTPELVVRRCWHTESRAGRDSFGIIFEVIFISLSFLEVRIAGKECFVVKLFHACCNI